MSFFIPALFCPGVDIYFFLRFIFPPLHLFECSHEGTCKKYKLVMVIERNRDRKCHIPINVVISRDRTWQISSGTNQIVAPIFLAILILNLALE